GVAKVDPQVTRAARQSTRRRSARAAVAIRGGRTLASRRSVESNKCTSATEVRGINRHRVSARCLSEQIRATGTRRRMIGNRNTSTVGSCKSHGDAYDASSGSTIVLDTISVRIVPDAVADRVLPGVAKVDRQVTRAAS